MTTTFETAKVGDRVWSVVHGWGTIYGTHNGSIYPIGVRFDHNGVFLHFDITGKYYKGALYQTLYWDEVTIVPPTQPEHVKYKNVNGFKVPDIGLTPEYGERYYYPMPTSSFLYAECRHTKDFECSVQRVDCRLCYPHTEKGKQAAITHAKAWLGEGEPWDVE